MKNALISPNEQIQYISGWVDYDTPIFSPIPNSERVAQVESTTFEVCPPLFWVECADNVNAEEWYFDGATSTILQIPAPAPRPPRVVPADQPVVTGAQTL